MSESPVIYVCLTTFYFVFTEPQLEGKFSICSYKTTILRPHTNCTGEDTLTDVVAYFQSDIFEQLEHLYIPLFVRYQMSMIMI